MSCTLKPCPKDLGNWTDHGECRAEGLIPTCGPGKQNKSRACLDGTDDLCTDYDRFKIVSCRLVDCPKILANWDTSAPCKPDNIGQNCGPGIQQQSRNCTDGTTDKCTDMDIQREIHCDLRDCPKILGHWYSEGECQSTGTYKNCGKGRKKELRTCIDGTSDKCTASDREKYSPCTMPNCFKEVGSWNNEGSCIGDGDRKYCGSGTQMQSRRCIDGEIFKCTASDIQRSLPCSLSDCPKIFGHWINKGECVALGNRGAVTEAGGCGPGHLQQTRTCVDGTKDKCKPEESSRILKCNLRDCPMIVGNWHNIGVCSALRTDQSGPCGPGTQSQSRTCKDGTREKCNAIDHHRTLACVLRDCSKQLGSWTNVGGCIAKVGGQDCTSGTQRSTRSCIDGTRDRCQSADRDRTTSCRLSECSGKI